MRRMTPIGQWARFRGPSAVVLAIALSTFLFRTDLMAQEDRRKISLSGARGEAAPTPALTPTPARPTTTLGSMAVSALTLSQMKGSWTAALSGYTGCGHATEYYEFTLDEFGMGTQSLRSGHATCGNAKTSGGWVQLQTFNPDGSGFIGFECGDSCGFWFFIQVSRNREMFIMSAEHVPGNYLSGVAIRK